MRLLVVDDEPNDIAMIKIAVEKCLKLLNNTDCKVIIASNVQQAKACIQNEKPDYVLTDLFMPQGDLSDLRVLCDEIEFPAGLSLLDSLRDTHIVALVTTFFWHYPGFSRYVDYLRDCSCVVGTLPKDLFYIVGRLHSDIKLEDSMDFPPLRILIQALSALLNTQRYEGNIKALNKMYYITLFEEASNWLSMHPDQVIEARGGLFRKSRSETISGKKDERHDLIIDINKHMRTRNWMPYIIYHSSACKKIIRDRRYKDAYKYLMQNAESGDDWYIHLELPTKAIKSSDPADNEDYDIDINGESIKYYFETFRPTSIFIEKFLTFRKTDHRNFAKILLTLGFFSYWCHIKDHRSLRTAQDLVTIMKGRANYEYKGGQDQITEDIDKLRISVDRQR